MPHIPYIQMMAHIQPPPFTGRARRAGRRAASPPDMTPLVGLGFLLVSFFLMAADFARPTVMELVMPVKPKHTELTQGCCGGSLITVILDKHNEIYYYPGLLYEGSETKAYRTDLSPAGLRQVLLDFRKKSCTMVLIKPSDQSSYQALVDVLDEMNITDTKRYALTDLSAEDQQLLDYAHQVKL